MPKMPPYKELEKRVQELEKQVLEMQGEAARYNREESQYRRIFDAAKDTFLIFDMNGVVREVNPAACRMYGYSRNEMIGLTGKDIVNPDFHHLFKDFVEKASQDIVFSAESVDIRKDGSTFPVEVRGSSLLYNGKPHLLAVVRDISERKEAEKALKESQEKLLQAQYVAGLGDFTWDIATGAAIWSDGMYALLKYNKTEPIDFEKVNRHIHHPDDLGRVTRWLSESIASGEKCLAPAEYRLIRKDGQVIHVQTNGQIDYEDGKAVRVFGTCLDITVRKNAEEKLRNSEEKFRLIAESSAEVIWQLDLDGHVTYVSPGVQTILGYTPEELMGMSFDAFFPDSEIQRVTDVFLRIVSGGSYQLLEFTGKRKDSSLIPMEFSVRPIIRNETVIGVQGIARDISERKRAEEILRESEKKYRLFVEAANEGVWAMDAAHRTTFVNRRMAEMLGYDEVEMLGQPVKTFMFEEDLHDHDAKVEQRKKGHGSAYERRFRRKDGSEIVTRVSATPIVDSEGCFGGSHALFTDITERKRSEEALRAAEETYRNLFLNSQIGLFRTDIKTGLILDANDAVAQFIGFKGRNALMAEPFNIADRYVDPEAREKMISLLKRDGEFQNYEARFRRNDGAILWMRYSARMVPEKGWVEGVSEDVTQEKLAELSLRKSEERFSSLFFSSPTWMAITRLADGAFLEVNKAFETITGFDRKEVVGRTSQELGIIPDSVQRDRLIRKAIEEGGFREEQMVFTTRKGEALTALWSADVIELAGETCLLSTIMDITELKRSREEMTKLEDQLHRAQKMEALGLLAGGVAHDLNNILSGIVSYPELILMDLPEDSPLRKPIRTIHESGMRAAGVVADLLTIARGVAIGKETLNLNRIIREYLDSPEFTKLEKTHSFVDFNTEVATDLLNMMGSPIHLKKVLMNLVVNATEAIEGKGSVRICTFNRYLDKPLRGYEDVRKGEYAVLSISDDGSGISPEDVERVFEPFYTKKVMGRSGTGLGLAVVWNTVQDHQGYVDVRSNDMGTTFDLYFPVTRDKIAEKTEPIALEVYMGHGEHILVVDDEESQREIATGILTKLGYHAVAVSGGEEAIPYVTEHAVDLIVLDMVMPKGINGRETYEAIIKIRPGQRAVIASGYARTEELDAAQKLGAGKYIRKPYTLEKIGIAVKEELAKPFKV